MVWAGCHNTNQFNSSINIPSCNCKRVHCLAGIKDFVIERVRRFTSWFAVDHVSPWDNGNIAYVYAKTIKSGREISVKSKNVFIVLDWNIHFACVWNIMLWETMPKVNAFLCCEFQHKYLLNLGIEISSQSQTSDFIININWHILVFNISKTTSCLMIKFLLRLLPSSQVPVIKIKIHNPISLVRKSDLQIPDPVVSIHQISMIEKCCLLRFCADLDKISPDYPWLDGSDDLFDNFGFEILRVFLLLNFFRFFNDFLLLLRIFIVHLDFYLFLL